MIQTRGHTLSGLDRFFTKLGTEMIVSISHNWEIDLNRYPNWNRTRTGSFL